MTETVTFAQLTEALTGLGFKKITTEEFTAYNNVAYDALLILPPEGLLPHPLPMHVAAARATVAGKGVATSAEFDRLLLRVMRPGRAPVPSMRSHAPAARVGKKAKKRSVAAVPSGDRLQGEVLTLTGIS